MKYLGNTLVKTAPLLMCSLSILFAYKVGLFNIGAAGQYCFGVALSLYAALGLGWSWLPCLLVAMVGGAVLTPDYARDIGADYYCKDAKASADLAKQLLG